MKVQEYLRSGKTLLDLENEFGITNRIKNGKVSLNYDMISSPMKERICQECRGLILREGTWDVVAYPFDKFFNHGEGHGSDIDWGTAVYQEKLDGSLVMLYWDDAAAKWFFATRSMPEADGTINGASMTFTELALMCFSEMGIDFESFTVKLNSCHTYMFELVSPYNRVVVNYNCMKMILIGVRSNYTLKELSPTAFASALGVPVPAEYLFGDVFDLAVIIDKINTLNPMEHEGLVVVDKNFNRVKIKSLPYVSLHGTISGVCASDRNIIRLIVLEKSDDVVGFLGSIVKEKMLSMQAGYVALIKALKEEYSNIKHIDNMKEFAAHASASTWPALMFALKRGKTESVESFMKKNVEADHGADSIIKKATSKL